MTPTDLATLREMRDSLRRLAKRAQARVEVRRTRGPAWLCRRNRHARENLTRRADALDAAIRVLEKMEE